MVETTQAEFEKWLNGPGFDDWFFRMVEGHTDAEIGKAIASELGLGGGVAVSADQWENALPRMRKLRERGANPFPGMNRESLRRAIVIAFEKEGDPPVPGPPIYAK